METIAAAFLLVAVSGNNQGPVTFLQLASYQDQAACTGAAEAMTAEVKAQGKMMVDSFACISTDALQSFGGQLIRPQE